MLTLKIVTWDLSRSYWSSVNYLTTAKREASESLVKPWMLSKLKGLDNESSILVL